MRSAKKSTSVTRRTPATHEGRRRFLKQGLMFGVLTATYSVVSLTDLGCHSSDNPIAPTDYHLDYHGASLMYY